ncbi:MAG: adenosylmethionine--8-amino-7-oxononanoate transaminase [Planctomycetes bacterium]|nr:adenosylmethionine--8-amino-7-oxononanoate transaminase [Planctomycetota bacterium]
MDEARIRQLAAMDHAHVWHPFTPMRQWREAEPLIIERGEGAYLIDARGHRYIDGVSSLWCNVHGHAVPEIDAAIRAQLDRIAHSTMLGLTHEPGIELAAKLCAIAPGSLSKVFYSDAGATATEVAFKMAVGYWHHRGEPERHTFIALDGAYHGDTVGAMSIGYSDLFHRPYRSMVFRTEFVPPGEAGAMAAKLDELGGRCAGVTIEPMVQGAAGMVMHDAAYLRAVATLCREAGVLLIADEVATGFGRTGTMFACEHGPIEPDLMCLGKGLSGGYLPLAATLCTDEIAAAFEGELHEFKTFYHGHTFTGNPLGCAAALASIALLEKRDLIREVRRKAKLLGEWLAPLAKSAGVKEVRQCGMMVGIELCDQAPPAAHAAEAGGSALGDFGESANRYARRIGYEVCDMARQRGVIIRPLGNVIVLMPPLAINDAALRTLVDVAADCIAAVKDSRSSGR